MGWRIKHLLGTGGLLAMAFAVAAATVSGPAAAAQHVLLRVAPPDLAPIYASVGPTARPPIGWVEFCIEYKPECRTKPLPPRDVVLSAGAWDDLVKVNLWVNRSIKPMTDLEHWGVIESWNFPDDGYGDCEDYVLLKRRTLMRAGWPRQALLITVVRDKKGDGHAVLTVETNRGEFILDNEVNEILPWYRTGYHFVKRQSQSDPNIWVALSEPRMAPPVVSAR